ncbi:MAG: adenylate/guanylate cyclase domain-containing protein [Selenomonadaceae bacterium]|nr:adenylate/guanylate cyclase domain-containing protein [Selenomonadaceae bacterium]
MISRKFFWHLFDALFAAIILTLLASAGLANELNNRLADELYQSAGEKSPDIVVIGIDNLTLSKIGAMNSIRRRDVAQAINFLNHNPSSRPAVIGVDALFTGNNPDDPEGDRLLAEACAKYKNVVVGAEAAVKDELASGDNPWVETWPLIPPYSALEEVTEIGHINAPNEDDGIVRHDLLYVNVEERGRLYSFARVIYEKFCRHKGIEPNDSPWTHEDGMFYLPFTAKTYSTDRNFYDLLRSNVPEEVFRDKIVLIGPYASGLQDAAPTSLDRSDLMFGIDIHANAIQAFMRGDFPCVVSDPPQLVILFIVCFFSEFYFRNARMCHITICWLVICFGWLALCHIFRQHGLILNVAWIPVAEIILFVGAVATNYALARAEKERVTETFERYVDPIVMRKLLDSKSPDLGGELKDIAVLFVDIRGFTSMSEELPPSTVVEILNRYLMLTTDCIRLYHGTLDKFVGDCTMAFWNAPVSQEQPVLLACRAALDMIAASELLGKELMARYGRKISFGIGINWGSAVVGNIGTSFRMDYTAIGDTVNTAARLEANAPGGTILISRTVADVLGDCANVTSLGNSIKLKGKSADFEVLVLNSLKDKE